MSDALLKAVLSMDAYNRGYNAGIDLNDRDVWGNPIPNTSDTINKFLGSAKIVATRGQSDAQNMGFYAIAYEYNDEVIVSYRGLDERLSALNLLLPTLPGGDLGSKDANHGFWVGGA